MFNKDEKIELRLTTQELQAFCDRWCENVYEREEHGSLGITPDEKAASYTGEVRRIADERCLDVLLAKPAGKDGIRVVSKKGIAYEGVITTRPNWADMRANRCVCCLMSRITANFTRSTLTASLSARWFRPKTKACP